METSIGRRWASKENAIGVEVSATTGVGLLGSVVGGPKVREPACITSELVQRNWNKSEPAIGKPEQSWNGCQLSSRKRRERTPLFAGPVLS